MAHVLIDEAGRVAGRFLLPQPHLDGYQEIDDADPRLKEFDADPMARFKAPAPSSEQEQR